MIRTGLIAASVIALGACTMIKINPGDTNTIEHDGGADVAKDLATRACVKAGQQNAVIVSTVNRDPALPPGSGKQVTTFRCS